MCAGSFNDFDGQVLQLTVTDHHITNIVDSERDRIMVVEYLLLNYPQKNVEEFQRERESALSHAWKTFHTWSLKRITLVARGHHCIRDQILH